MNCNFVRNGCSQIFDNESLLRGHEKKCLFQKDECPQCDQPVLRKMLIHHVENECEMRVEMCMYCGTELSHKYMLAHRDSCLHKPVVCKFCQQKMIYKDYKAHFERCHEKPHVCDMRDLGCDFQSNKEVLEVYKREVDAHISILSGNVRKLLGTTHDLKVNNVHLINQTERMAADLEGLNNHVKDAKENQLACDSTLDKYKFKLVDFKTNYDSLAGYVESIANENKEHSDDIARLKDYTEELQAQNASLKEEYHILKPLLEESECKTKVLQDGSSQVVNTMEDIGERQVEIKKEIGEMKHKIEQIDTENHSINNFNSVLNDHTEEIVTESEEIKEDALTLKDKVDSILKENKKMNNINIELRDYMENLAGETANIQESNTKLKKYIDDYLSQIKELKDKIDASMKRDKNTWVENQFELRAINSTYGSRVESLEEKINNLLITSKNEILILHIGRHVWLQDKSLEDIKHMLARQLFGSPDKQRDNLVEVVPGIDIDEVLIEHDLGLRNFGGIQYGLKLKQVKGILTKDDRVVKLYIDQQKSDQEWPPDRADRVMWCITDDSHQKVHFYQIKDGRLNSNPQSELQYKVFGWFFINKEEQLILREKTNHKRLHSAFLIYKNPT